MPVMNDIRSSIGYAVGILLVATFLALWQWFDRRSRDPNSTALDRDFYRRQDLRRYVGVGVMVVLAFLLVAVSSQALAEYNKIVSLVVLVIVCVLIVVLLALAFFDAIATQRYARRQFKSLAQERTKIMLDAIGGGRASTSRRQPPEKQNKAPEV
jgi:hypothetical protein